MRILVVEDEKKVAAFIRQALTEAGHVVDVEHTGQAGFDVASTGRYDLIVLDRLLPQITGTEICRQLRELGSQSRILMVTARDAVTDRVEGLDAGADDYLTKPFSIDELLARVRSLLRRRGDMTPSELRANDLTVNTASREVTRAGRAVTLSYKEYALLEYLMRNTGRTLTRTMIAEHVWDFDFDSGSNVIDVYIRYLRAKIDDGHEEKLIKTIRGVGYQIG